ncbi:MAG: mannose-1-phosphate guanylyltransferase/mannose-6-phosphate isomerase [Desulfovibrionaceae bacterium]|nr:mannose-1-phosphate guanylyltransferase/mannose-6-phosphate isomerase [Desulfovibrionaceae bacterium]
MKCTPVILSGGSGTRLWPLSRSSHPKQFIEFKPGQSLFAMALSRAARACGNCAPIVVSNETYRFYVAGFLSQAKTQGKILLEPSARNTAPAIALAALAILEEEDALMLVLPSDHLIRDDEYFAGVVAKASVSAEKGHFVTFGVVPTKPETGYGYIQQGEALPEEGSFAVARFVEKPPLADAEAMLADGRYLWNSGMFLVKASRYMEELERFAPEIAVACRKAWAGKTIDGAFVRPDKKLFEQAPAISVDYAVLEKTDQTSVCRFNSQWNDMGTWEALYQAGERDENENVTHGDVMLENSSGCFVYSQNHLIAALDLQDIDVIETDDAVLVAPRQSHQRIKVIVDRLKQQGRPEYQNHPVVYRPWGKFESLTSAERFQVKRITVKPGGTLSLQRHYHRAEHWIVVSGTAQVTVGEKELLLTPNQSVYIPIGEKHRLRNPGKIDLDIIEVQSGDYLGEDDIERFEDVYGRNSNS